MLLNLLGLFLDLLILGDIAADNYKLAVVIDDLGLNLNEFFRIFRPEKDGEVWTVKVENNLSEVFPKVNNMSVIAVNRLD